MMRLLGLTLLPLLLAADWPQHLGPNRDCYSSETGLLRAWPKDGPTVLWKRELGRGWSGPVVAGGKLIQFHRVDNQEVVECLESNTGKALWKSGYPTRYRDDFNFDDGPRSSPLILADRVLTLGADGDLAAWNLADGKELWRRNLNRDFGVDKGFFGVATSPMQLDKSVVINVGVKGASVVAFDPATGRDVWKAGDDAVSYSSPILAKLDGEEQAVFFTRQGLLTLNASGKIRYQYPWRPRLNASVNAATPIVADNRIYLSTSYGTGAIVLQANKGELEEVWKGDGSLSNHYCTPVKIDKHLYGIDGRAEGGRADLRCVDWQTGKVLWKETTGCANLIAVDGMLLVQCESGQIRLMEPSPKGYQELARSQMLQAPARALPALANRTLFVRDDQHLYALQLGK